MAIFNISPEFDLNYYRQNYPELNNFPDEIVAEHCRRFAVEQGHSTCPYDRREYLQKILQNIIDQYRIKVLEISPWDNAFLRGDTVKYFDSTDVETLRKKSEEAKRNINNLPERIDFVSPNCDLSIVDEKFDVVFSSHVVEHTPDLVEHFQAVSKILNRGGLYILIVPDKRYCFDYYHADSTITEVLDAFACEKKIPRLADVINQAFTRTHNDPILHWRGEHGERYGEQRTIPLTPDLGVEVMGEYFFDEGNGINREYLFRLVEKYSEALENGRYISTHNWRFTPDTFGHIVRTLTKLQFIDLKLHRLCHTLWGRFEFVTMLEKI